MALLCVGRNAVEKDIVMRRLLGRSGIAVSSIGMGCWAIGSDWGTVDDTESVRALQRALDLGVTFFDTSNAYGAGRSEHLIGQALAGRRDQAVIATKFGYIVNERTGRVNRNDASPDAIRRTCEAALQRLKTDYIDLFQFHLGSYPLNKAGEVRESLEALVAEGKIRFYGWSTDDPERARFFAEGYHCATVQHELNLFHDNAPMLAVCEQANLASINRSPLAMGLLTGKYTADVQFPASDVRRASRWWEYFRRDTMPALLQKVDAVREILTSDGRTLVQGALGWLLARNERTIPIPGFKTVAQVEENAGTLRFGPLGAEQMQEIEQLLVRPEG
jgi:aryl-alcohol dehydrogenase-like predicted oxidoreductase